MDLRFSEEQEALRDSARKFLQKAFDMQSVLAMWEDERGYAEDNWSTMADLGWLGLRIPEEYQGLGLTFVDLAVLVEEMGRVAMPGPFLSTLLAAEAIIDAGSPEQKRRILPEIAGIEPQRRRAIEIRREKERACVGRAAVGTVRVPAWDEMRTLRDHRLGDESMR